MQMMMKMLIMIMNDADYDDYNGKYYDEAVDTDNDDEFSRDP